MSKAAKKSSPSDSVTRESIEEQISEFLKKGGAIQQIPTGTSGIDNNKPGPKHIVINNKK